MIVLHFTGAVINLSSFQSNKPLLYSCCIPVYSCILHTPNNSKLQVSGEW